MLSEQQAKFDLVKYKELIRLKEGTIKILRRKRDHINQTLLAAKRNQPEEEKKKEDPEMKDINPQDMVNLVCQVCGKPGNK